VVGIAATQHVVAKAAAKAAAAHTNDEKRALAGTDGLTRSGVVSHDKTIVVGSNQADDDIEVCSRKMEPSSGCKHNGDCSDNGDGAASARCGWASVDGAGSVGGGGGGGRNDGEGEDEPGHKKHELRCEM
jgi:hypothetical protein